MSRSPFGLRVFAVEDRVAQLTWSRLGPGRVRFEWNGRQLDHMADGRAGAVTLDGFEPGATTLVTVSGVGLHEPRHLTVTTQEAPPGRELYRFATLSDMHLGTTGFGVRGRIREPAGTVPHPLRCSAAALTEALAWGARRFVIKGDVVHRSRPHTWAMAGDLFAGLPVPVDLIPGNHDVALDPTVDCFGEAERLGLRLHRGVNSLDVDGLRLVLMDSSVPDVDIGRWNHLRSDCCDAVAGAGGPAMVLVHHQPQPLPFPVYLPRGIPSTSANHFMRSLARANPSVMGSSGHTHRHRRHQRAGITWSEVGSPKDYPGTWAGYIVYEGGVRQVVYRVAEPSVIDWTDYTRRAALWTWGLWSPGRLEDRCFTVTW